MGKTKTKGSQEKIDGVIDVRGKLYYLSIMTKEKLTKEKLIEILQNILNTDIDLSFLLELKKSELEMLVACIRGRIDQAGE